MHDLLHSATPADWHPDFAAQRAGENGEISAQDAMEILGVEVTNGCLAHNVASNRIELTTWRLRQVGDDPNCMHSDNDFVISGEHPHFEHLRPERDGFAKVFVWSVPVIPANFSIMSIARTFRA